MESRAPESGDISGELFNRMIEGGIASVRQAYGDNRQDATKLEGSLDGFELARYLPASYLDFDWFVIQREEKEKLLLQEPWESKTEAAKEEYWQYYWATVQLDYCREILLAAKQESAQPLPKNFRPSARAIRRYVNIVGINKQP